MAAGSKKKLLSEGEIELSHEQTCRMLNVMSKLLDTDEGASKLTSLDSNGTHGNNHDDSNIRSISILCHIYIR